MPIEHLLKKLNTKNEREGKSSVHTIKLRITKDIEDQNPDYAGCWYIWKNKINTIARSMISLDMDMESGYHESYANMMRIR